MDDGDPWAELRAERDLLARVVQVAGILAAAEADGREQVAAWAADVLGMLLD